MLNDARNALLLLAVTSGLMFILTITSRISFQRSANGFRNSSEKQRRMMFFDSQGQKVLLKAEFEGTPGLLAEAGSIFWIPALAASSLSTYGSDTGSE